jgi:hypothetical protein
LLCSSPFVDAFERLLSSRLMPGVEAGAAELMRILPVDSGAAVVAAGAPVTVLWEAFEAELALRCGPEPSLGDPEPAAGAEGEDSSRAEPGGAAAAAMAMTGGAGAGAREDVVRVDTSLTRLADEAVSGLQGGDCIADH